MTQLFVITVDDPKKDFVNEYFQQHSAGTFGHLIEYGQIYYLGDKDNLVEIKASNWSEVVKKMIEAGEWVKAMSLMVQVKQNKTLFIPVLEYSEQRQNFS